MLMLYYAVGFLSGMYIGVTFYKWYKLNEKENLKNKKNGHKTR